MADVTTIEIMPNEADQRLDRWLGRRFPYLGFGNIQKLVRTGQVRINGKRAKAADKVQTGDTVRIPPLPNAAQSKKQSVRPKSAESAEIIARLKQMVLFEDDDVLVLNKPPGLAVQGGSGVKESLDEMVKLLAGKGEDAPRLVHRLDKETSGVLCLAKNLSAANKLTEAFREHETRKIYWAITVGVPQPPAGRILLNLRKSGERMVVGNGPDAKSAETDYRVLDKKKDAAFVMLWPRTGRTHQLRVHLAHGQTPILGDKAYGGSMPETWQSKPLGKGLHLLARRIMMPHPRRGVIDVTAPLSAALRPSWAAFGFDDETDEDF